MNKSFSVPPFFTPVTFKINTTFRFIYFLIKKMLFLKNRIIGTKVLKFSTLARTIG